MKYHNITHDDMLNGDGLRVVLWLSGCSHHCPGCQNPITWDPSDGLEFGKEAKEEIFNELRKDYVAGITFSGGDPLFLENRDGVCQLAQEIKARFPQKTIWVYSGYLWEIIKDLPVMQYIDVLVDGPYIEALRSPNKPWVGSSNQRVVDVKRSCGLAQPIAHTVRSAQRSLYAEN